MKSGLLKIFFVLLLVIFGMLVVSCGRTQQTQPKPKGVDKTNANVQKTVDSVAKPDNIKSEKIVIGYPTISMTWFPLKVAVEKGFLKSEGLDVELVTMIKSDVAIGALLNGDVHYITHLGSTMRAAIAQNVPIRAVFVSSGPVWSLVGGKDITSFEQLKGKTVGGGTPGASEDFFSRIAYKHFGLEPDKDIKVIALGGSGLERIAALEKGIVAGTTLATPDNIRATEKGFKILGRVGDAVKSPVGGLGTTVDRITNNPEQVQRVLRGMLKGVQFIRENKEESSKIISEWVKLNPAQSKMAYDQVVAGYIDGVASDQEILLDPTLIEAGLNSSNMDKVRDFSLVNKVRKEMGINK